MNGILLINKPPKKTSHDIVYQVKKITGEKVGHIGTLDPLATGVLPLLIGKATSCSKYLINHNKKYEVLLQLGESTTTGDLEGEIIERKDFDLSILNEEYIKSKLNTFIGKQEQIPPMYSAIKVKGKKLYEYAREGQKVEIKPRNIEIYNIELLNIDKDNKRISFKVSCSKGTYIRSLCEDIAKSMDTVGYMRGLKRVQVGDFSIDRCLDLKELDDVKIKRNLITIQEIFEKLPTIDLNDRKLSLFLNGVQLTFKKEDGVYQIYNNKEFIGTGIVKNNLLKRDIIEK